MATKKSAKPAKAKAKPAKVAQKAPAARKARPRKVALRPAPPTTKPVLDLSFATVWDAKVAIQAMTAPELDAFENEHRGMVRHGAGILATIEARRAELKSA